MIINLFNGDAAAAKFEPASGERVIVWREALTHGPVALDRAEHRALRSEWLAGQSGHAASDVAASLDAQDEALSSATPDDALRIWVEADLQCQLVVAYVAHHAPANVPLQLISVGEFPGRPHFRGLGELSADELASLRSLAREMSGRERAASAALWHAYVSADARDVQQWIDERSAEAGPHLRTAARLHTSRFPSSASGEPMHIAALLDWLRRSGPTEFVTLFDHFVEGFALLGFGDLQLFGELQAVADAAPGLLELSGARDELPHVRLSAGSAAVRPSVTQWLGGARVSWADSRWVYDAAEQRLVSRGV